MAFGACSKKPAGKRYELQGRVVAVDSGPREITVAHQDIPGLMPGMTMPFHGGARRRLGLRQDRLPAITFTPRW